MFTLNRNWRFKPTPLLALCAALACLTPQASGQSKPEFAKGDVVLLTSPGEMRVGAEVVRELDDNTIGIRLHVLEINGPWLWVRVLDSGWVHQRHVTHVDKAIEVFTSMIAKDPDNHRAFFGRANARAFLGDLDGAIRDAQQAQRLFADSIAAYCLEADLWLVKGQWDKVIATASEAISRGEGLTDELRPMLADAYYKRGFGEHMKGDLAAAEQDYSQSLRLEPDSVMALCRRGIVRRSSGRLDEAIRDFTDALKIESKYGPARCDRGLAYQLKGDFAAAEQDFRKTIATFPDHVFSPQSRSDAVYQSTGVTAQSVKLLDPERSALYNLVRLKACCTNDSVRSGEGALEFAGALHKLDQGRFYAFVAIEAAAYAEAGDFDRAKQLQGRAIQLAPTDKQDDLQRQLEAYNAQQPLRLELAAGPH
ncbi:MAG: tetratricopeptide repeat protein [Planctomycetales bacterium]|nr:tetratricopeptide repeat protein [Planctomycetales bacterium]